MNQVENLSVQIQESMEDVTESTKVISVVMTDISKLTVDLHSASHELELKPRSLDFNSKWIY